MSQDLTQWITEVRTLQRQLADTQKDRDQAYNSAANWRRLYETEARQRREEAAEFQTQLQALQQRLDADPGAVLEKDLATVGSLQGYRSVSMGWCSSAKTSPSAFRPSKRPTPTRQTLTAALGDTFDALK
jgi:hypothetical protein